MYTTIEAKLEDGKLKGEEVRDLPKNARILITLLSFEKEKKRPVFGTATSDPIKMSKDALAPLTDQELKEWGL